MKDDIKAEGQPGEAVEAAAEERHEKKIKKAEKSKKKLCKLVKDDYLKKHFKEYRQLVADPEFLCGKCGRAAKEKASLCKPAPMKASKTE